MSREIRQVPKNWNHQKWAGTEKFVPIMNINYDEQLERFTKDPENEFEPSIDHCLPYSLKECDCIQLYETVSFGTPLSPVCASTDELKAWLLSNKDFWGNQWSESEIDNLIKNGWTPTLIISL